MRDNTSVNYLFIGPLCVCLGEDSKLKLSLSAGEMGRAAMYEVVERLHRGLSCLRVHFEKEITFADLE